MEAQAHASDHATSLPLWFQQNCRDADWVRLLAWESLQTMDDVVLDETERQHVCRRVAGIIKQNQAEGRLRGDVAPEHLHLAKISLAMFPVAMPQMTRLITGHSPRAPKFQRAYAKFLETISPGFRTTPEKAKQPSNLR